MSIWKTVEYCMRARTPILIWGDPGIGKTARVEQLAAKLGMHLEIVIASIRDPSDFAGLPVKMDLASATNPADKIHVESGKLVAMAPPAWAVRLKQAKRPALMLDELTTAAPATQAAMLRVVNEQFVGDLELPPTSIIAAANPTDTAAGGWELPPAQANRFAHVNCVPDAREWCDWAYGCGDAALAHVAGFIQAHPTQLHQLPRSETQRGRAWPSPRTWDLAAQTLAVCPDYRGPDAQAALSAFVGDAAAVEYIQWAKALDLPDPEAVLANPHGWSVPRNRSDIVMVVLASVTQIVLAHPSPLRWRQAAEVMAYAAGKGEIDTILPFARLLAKNKQPGVDWADCRGVGDLFPVFKQAGLIQ